MELRQTNLIHVIKRVLTAPFRKHFLFLIAFLVFTAGTDVIRQCSLQLYPNAFYMAAYGFCLAYGVTLLISLIKSNKLRTIIQAILIIAASISFALNFYCILELDDTFDKDFALLLMETNWNEAHEFVTSMLPLKIVLILGAIYSIFLVLWRLSRRHNLNLGRKGSIIALIAALVFIPLTISQWHVCRYGPIHRITEFAKVYDVPYDLKSYYTHPSIDYADTELMPSNVVLIIGESFARFHSSFYGYEKNTNPHLNALRDSSLLFTFDSIESPAATTSLSFRYMLSTFDKTDDTRQDKHWYEYTTLIELMQDCGYDCYWFSTQARGGYINGSARVYARACEKSWYLQKPGAVLNNNETLDIVLADSSRVFSDTINQSKRHFVIYHMMGSHFDYKMRYPKEFDHFKPKDYSDCPTEQQEILASFDNSILYNDYIVEKLIELYDDKETVVIYLSDHGQDMFRSAPDYFMHGKENDPASYQYGIEIPFMVYLSPAYQARHPQIVELLRNCQNNPKKWNSDYLPYMIMDLIGVSGIDGEAIKPYSLFSSDIEPN